MYWRPVALYVVNAKKRTVIHEIHSAMLYYLTILLNRVYCHCYFIVIGFFFSICFGCFSVSCFFCCVDFVELTITCLFAQTLTHIKTAAFPVLYWDYIILALINIHHVCVQCTHVHFYPCWHITAKKKWINFWCTLFLAFSLE